MNEKFTDGQLKDIMENPAWDYTLTRDIVEALLAERAERAKNPGVWDGAPEDTNQAQVVWYKNGLILGSKRYTRELPKTRAREIAEKWEKRWYKADVKSYADNIEAAILEYAEGLK